ncbi:MAG: ribonuclease P protein component 1 [Candidatus Iainarchaeum sp.]|jgi:ribonuclease P protein subunit POP4|nr:MAG: Ribonuclease P protein component 1 [archaeon ADurb.Bin336]
MEGKCYKITKENVLAHELIGLKTSVIESTDPKRVGVKGIILDETQKTFIINSSGVKKIIPKKECVFEFDLNGEKVLIEGKKILKRSEERTKDYRG